LKKKDEEMFLRIQKKIKDIVQHPNHYKNLKKVLAGYQRIHFGSFVLIFKVDEDRTLLE
jgi:mRNA-degrading endonuclease RelE of RelBE toxin-antitoxin system